MFTQMNSTLFPRVLFPCMIDYMDINDTATLSKTCKYLHELCDEPIRRKCVLREFSNHKYLVNLNANNKWLLPFMTMFTPVNMGNNPYFPVYPNDPEVSPNHEYSLNDHVISMLAKDIHRFKKQYPLEQTLLICKQSRSDQAFKSRFTSDCSDEIFIFHEVPGFFYGVNCNAKSKRFGQFIIIGYTGRHEPHSFDQADISFDAIDDLFK